MLCSLVSVSSRVILPEQPLVDRVSLSKLGARLLAGGVISGLFRGSMGFFLIYQRWDRVTRRGKSVRDKIDEFWGVLVVHEWGELPGDLDVGMASDGGGASIRCVGHNRMMSVKLFLQHIFFWDMS